MRVTLSNGYSLFERLEAEQNLIFLPIVLIENYKVGFKNPLDFIHKVFWKIYDAKVKFSCNSKLIFFFLHIIGFNFKIKRLRDLLKFNIRSAKLEIQIIHGKAGAGGTEVFKVSSFYL